jgi:hypothetical protein
MRHKENPNERLTITKASANRSRSSQGGEETKCLLARGRPINYTNKRLLLSNCTQQLSKMRREFFAGIIKNYVRNYFDNHVTNGLPRFRLEFELINEIANLVV